MKRTFAILLAIALLTVGTAQAHTWTPSDGGNLTSYSKFKNDVQHVPFDGGANCVYMKMSTEHFVHDAANPPHVHLDHLVYGFWRNDAVCTNLTINWLDPILLKVYDGSDSLISTGGAPTLYNGTGSSQPSTAWRQVNFGLKVDAWNPHVAYVTLQWRLEVEREIPGPNDFNEVVGTTRIDLTR